jgi:MSHA biogenesis protein MshK
MARHLMKACLALLAAALPAAAAYGQAALSDPTRPPAALIGEQFHAGAALATGPVLQSVLISRERKTAIIGGERVEVGGRYGEARLVRLSDTEAVLEGPDGRTVLRLLPDAERRPAAVSSNVGGKRSAAVPKAGEGK